MRTYSHPKLADVPLEVVMQALADPCRVAIVRALLQTPNQSASELPVEVAKATLHHHMDVLRQAGLIETIVEGRRCLSTVRRAEVDARFPHLLALVGAPEPSER